MKCVKKIMITLLLVSWMFSAGYSCDICGCGMMGSGMSSFAWQQRGFIGLSVGKQNFQSNHPPLFGIPSDVTSQESFRFVQLNGSVKVTDSLYLGFGVPYLSSQKKELSDEWRQSGIGDISISIQSPLYKFSGLSSEFQLIGGVDFELPTGKHTYNANDLTTNPNIQNGSGSWDYGISLRQVYRRGKFEQWTQLNFMKFGTAESGFRFGPRGQMTFMTRYEIDLPNEMAISPLLGFSGTSMSKDINQGQSRDFSGGSFWLMNFGVQLRFRDHFLTAQISKPIAQHVSQGYTIVNQQFSIACFQSF